MNCDEKLLEPTIFFNLYTKSKYYSGSESPWRKRDLSPTCNLDIKFKKGFAKFIVPIALFKQFLS